MAGLDLVVHGVEALAVARLEGRTQQLAHPGQQPVVPGETLRLQQEVARDLVRVQVGVGGDLLQRLRDQGARVAAADGVDVRHDHREQERLLAAAVQEDLADVGAGGEGGLQLGDGDEFTLREFDDVVAAVQIHQVVGPQLGHDVAGLVEPLVVEDLRRQLRVLEVSGNHVAGLQV